MYTNEHYFVSCIRIMYKYNFNLFIYKMVLDKELIMYFDQVTPLKGALT